MIGCVAMEQEKILIKGAREHNLKNIDVEIPKKSFVVITGVSGSGKSSLALDTLFAEGQRRYVESLSSYARQFLGQAEKPKFDTIRGLAPTIAIEQKSSSKNPRSTVGTITEVYDYLRVLYARIGIQHCVKCGKRVGRGDASQMVEQILTWPEATKLLILAPIVENRKGEHRELFADLRKDGISRVRIDGVVTDLADVQALSKNKKHNIEAVVDRLVIRHDGEFKSRLTDTVETALKLGQGNLIVHVVGREDVRMSEAKSCCGIAYPPLDPPLFSFNAPIGACEECNGLGSILLMDPEKIVPDPTLSIRDGAVLPWRSYFMNENDEGSVWGKGQLLAMEKQWGLDLDKPWKSLPKAMRERLLHGASSSKGAKSKAADLSLQIKHAGRRHKGTFTIDYEGLVPALMRRYRQTQSEDMKAYYNKYLSSQRCPSCEGKRLKPHVLAVKVGGRSISDLTELTTKDALEFFKKLELKGNQELIGSELLKEIIGRLGFLVGVGLDYLSLDRKGPTLSGGEAQRIRLAAQIGSELSGVIYVLDEPSIGLHQKDNRKLIEAFKSLRDIGNTVVVIEHDQETMEAADWLIDVGPGAGHLGGQIVASGTPKQVTRNTQSLTGQYLSGKRAIPVRHERRTPTGAGGNRWLEVVNATENNLKSVTARIPLGLFTCVTGVSGAGKSTLIKQVLYPALARKLHGATVEVGEHERIEGLEHIDKVVHIDQGPIGRTPRSNPATYTKVFDAIRDWFAQLPESRARGYTPGRFSFNVKGGRCETCQGDGFIRVEMHFLADIFVPCEVCHGKRFNEATLAIRHKTHSIADVLDMSVAEASELFANHPDISRILKTLMDVGLSYVKLGQPATTLSGGEAQRIKLARELARRDTGRTFYILDEPTTGLHFEDINKLLAVLQRLVDAGNTVLVIEHNLDVIKSADWLIDMGPDGGKGGGQIIATGSPEAVAKSKKGYTSQFL
jgi:excinuclease ABC subunit A